MGLKADIEEVRTAWANSTWLIRAWLVLSGLLALSSITSLSESVVKWKGFIRDGLDLYQMWIRDPFIALAQMAGVRFSQPASDFLVVQAILMACWVRSLAAATNWEDKADRRSTISTAVFGAVVVCAMAYAFNGREIKVTLAPILSTVLFFFVAPLFIERRRYAPTYFAQLIAVTLTIGVLGAINRGLSS